jgi:hypothetical protein
MGKTPLYVLLDDDQDKYLKALQSKLTLGRTSAVKMAIVIAYNQEVVGKPQKIDPSVIQENAEKMVSETGISKAELDKILANI